MGYNGDINIYLFIYIYMCVCICVWKALQQRVNKFHVHVQPPLNCDSKGTQHVTGIVANEATSEMGYPAWPAGRTCKVSGHGMWLT